ASGSTVRLQRRAPRRLSCSWPHRARAPRSLPARRSSDLVEADASAHALAGSSMALRRFDACVIPVWPSRPESRRRRTDAAPCLRSEEHTSELQSRENIVCRLLLEKKNSKYRPARETRGGS